MRGLARSLIIAALMIAALSPAVAETCSLAVVHCKQKAIRQPDRDERCAAAGAQCIQTGTFTAPYTGRVLHGFTKR
jgi:hypothetical protein